MALNPNRDIEEMFRKPKSKFLRRVMATYVRYVEAAGFVFVFLMLSALVFLIFFKNEVTLSPKDADKVKLRPQVMPVSMEAPSRLIATLCVPEEKVTKGKPLFVIQKEGSAVPDTVPAPADGYITVKKGSRSPFEAALGDSLWNTDDVLVEVVDFSRLKADLKFESGDFYNVKRGAKVYVKPVFKDKRAILLELEGKDISEVLSLNALPEGFQEEFKEAIIGNKVTGRDNKTQYKVMHVEDLKELEIRAVFLAENSETSASSYLYGDSLYNTEVIGRIDSGRFQFEYEVTAGIPQEIRQLVKERASGLRGKTIQGKSRTLQLMGLKEIYLKAKIVAGMPIDSSVIAARVPEGIESSAITKKWLEAELLIDSPPEFLQHAAWAAYKQGGTLHTTAVRVVIAEQSMAKQLFSKN